MKFAHFIVNIRTPISTNKYIIWTQQNYTIVTLPLRFVTVSLTFQIEEIEQFSRKRTLSLLFVYTKQPFFFSLISHLFNAKVCLQCASFGLIYSRNSGILKRKQPQPSRQIKFFWSRIQRIQHWKQIHFRQLKELCFPPIVEVCLFSVGMHDVVVPLLQTPLPSVLCLLARAQPEPPVLQPTILNPPLQARSSRSWERREPVWNVREPSSTESVRTSMSPFTKVLVLSFDRPLLVVHVRGPGFMSNVMQGLAFGTGSAVAHEYVSPTSGDS